MLFIGDIHITSKHASAILQQIADTVQISPDEKHLVFLWDYVYHFTYDRKALLLLFSFFISLAKQGKYIYLLAGNHDRIAHHFVFEEAKQILDYTWSTHIYCITEPTYMDIEWVSCLFLPFYYPTQNTFATDRYPELYNEKNPQLMMSWRINNILQEHIGDRKARHPWKKILLIHHWYIANTQFPGQQATFWYTSPALDPLFLEDTDIRSVSWHLHQSFCYKQYLCTWSIRHTSPLEINQQKYAWLFSEKNWSRIAQPLRYNPYFQTPYPETPLTPEQLYTIAQEVYQNSLTHLTNGGWDIAWWPFHTTDFSHTTLTLTTTSHQIGDLSYSISQDLQKQIWALKHKLIQKTESTLLPELERASLDLQHRFSDWKILLRRFLEHKYWAAASQYLDILEEEHIL